MAADALNLWAVTTIMYAQRRSSGNPQDDIVCPIVIRPEQMKAILDELAQLRAAGGSR